MMTLTKIGLVLPEHKYIYIFFFIEGMLIN